MLETTQLSKLFILTISLKGSAKMRLQNSQFTLISILQCVATNRGFVAQGTTCMTSQNLTRYLDQDISLLCHEGHTCLMRTIPTTRIFVFLCIFERM